MAKQSDLTNQSTDQVARKIIGKTDEASFGTANHADRTVDSNVKSKVESKSVAKTKTPVANDKTFSPVQRLLKKPPKVLAIWAAILLGGGAIAYLNFAQNAPRSLSPAGTQLVPKTALATATVTTDELAWTKLRQFGTADSQELFEAFLADWQSQLFTANGYSFRRDIKPWIGDRVTLAVLPDRNSQNMDLASATRNLMLVVPIADPAKAKALLDPNTENTADNENDNEKAEPERKRRTYKGIQIQTIESDMAPALASAVIGTNWLLLSNTDEGIEQAIDTYRSKRSLLDNDGYRKAATRVESPQPRGKNFAQIYLNIPAATEVMAPPAGLTNRPTGSLIPLQGSEGIVATALLESEGIRFEGTSWLSPKNDLAYGGLSNEAGEMPRRLPGDALVMMSGSNLQQTWRAFSEGNTAPPFFPNPQNLKAGLLTQTGLDIDEDIMPWAAGEFAIGLLPPVPPTPVSPSSEAGGAGGDQTGTDADQANEPTAEEPLATTPAIASAPLLMMVQTNDRATAESVWSQIDDVMVNRYRYQVKTENFDGGSITEWISPFQGVQFSHGWLPGNVAFFAVGDGAAEAIAPNPAQPLSSTRLFQTLTSRTPNPNNGQFYIDLESINAQGGAFPLPQIPTEGPTAAIQAIGLTSTLGDRTMNYDLYVKLAQLSDP